jgi:hypothetical protein
MERPRFRITRDRKSRAAGKHPVDATPAAKAKVQNIAPVEGASSCLP